jgi:pullulanase-type alpha-1,6-glucosidase
MIMRVSRRLLLGLLMAAILLLAGLASLAQDDGAVESVTIAGTVQVALGCANDWAPECEASMLAYDEANDLWTSTFDLPAGDYEYKAALNGNWDVNYGAEAEPGGANVALSLAEDTSVTFYFDAKTGYVTDSISTTEFIVAVGSFQDELGCASDFDPTCLRTWMQDADGNNIFNFVTTALPVGDYEVQVARDALTEPAYFGGDETPLTFSVPGEGYQVNVALSARRNAVSVNVRDPQAVVVVPTIAVQPVTGIFTAPGTYQRFLGCEDTTNNGGNWEPACLITQLTDDGSGMYSFTFNSVPAGSYLMKVAVNQSWDENYGQDGTRGGADIPFEIPVDYATVTFTFDPLTRQVTITVDETNIGGPLELEVAAVTPDLSQQRAYWVARDTILIDLSTTPADLGINFKLYYSPDAALVATETGFDGGESLDLTFMPPDDRDPAILEKFPHLASMTPYAIAEADLDKVPDILRGQFGVVGLGEDGRVYVGTGLQIPGVLDDVYATDARLGVTFDGNVPVLRLWAPTAINVRLMVFDDTTTQDATVIDMERFPRVGVWQAVGDASWYGKYYLYEVTAYYPWVQEIQTHLVTDPYALSLSLNSARSQIIDLNDAALKPEGWDTLAKPALDAPEDIVVYELHVRDFSANDATVSDAARGTFKAFTELDSDGMQHLLSLQAAGLSHVHLLPAFDIATINENAAERSDPDPAVLGQFPPDSEEQQAAVNAVRDADSFNWGYDPYHYTVPEGSYSTDPDGPQRIIEFREMVQTLNENGLRVVMDVVYNHTNASGLSEKSTLDKIVPGYYYRLSRTGGVETSTCCPNTATEHYMMERLMIDSVVVWAEQYKVDAFRFDLMGHHMKRNMEKLRAALDSLNLDRDGVDGTAVYVYGEGWNFGEVADNARGVNATQINLAGTGIGTFSDRLRDAVRGGSPFGDREFLGFVSGLGVIDNGLTGGTADEQAARAALFMDQVRIGLAGNLSAYAFIGSSGETVTGADVLYNGQPTGYTADPQEHIVYISKHDNETLWDIIAFKQIDAPLDEIVRIHNLGYSVVMLSQGVPFVHAGDDLLRSKSMDRDSYNSGDWFNRIFWDGSDNNWGAGVPIADKNQERWDVMGPLLANPDLKPTPEQIQAASDHFKALLQIRMGSPLFRLQTADEVQARVSFLNTGPEQTLGVIVMVLDDTGAVDLDPQAEKIVVVFNARPEAYTLSDESLAALEWALHPVLADGADEVVKAAAFADGEFTVPGRTAAVFVGN